MNTPFLAMFSPMQMFIVAVLVLILFGAKKLPVFARSLGRSLGEFKRAKDDFEREMNASIDDSYHKPEQRIEAPKPPTSVETPKAQSPLQEPPAHQA